MFLISKTTGRECRAAQWTGEDSLNSFLLMFPECSFRIDKDDLLAQYHGVLHKRIFINNWLIFQDCFYHHFNSDFVSEHYRSA